MDLHKHQLKFVRRGVYFVRIEGFPYLITWDFVCKTCNEQVQVDREGWKLKLLGKGGIPWVLGER